MAGVSTPAATTSYARDVRVTWWYTAGSILLFHVTAIGIWSVPMLVRPTLLPAPLAIGLFFAGSAASFAAATALLTRYRREPVDGGDDIRTRPPWVLVLVGVAAATAMAFGTGSVVLGTCIAAYILCLVRWRNGIRLRLVTLLMVVIVAVWIVDATRVTPAGDAAALFGIVLFVALLPTIAATSLWWWDIVRELDRARRAEGRLAAAQERLRLASDLHDLQGHHLQVIALQLEPAEKMMGRDPEAAVEQVRAARASVDEARRGTRDLATRFRGVPLPDELANAADLLRAAGLTVELLIDAEAGRAPADVLGPVIREATTNVLKHGGGVSASLALARHRGEWVLTVENDLPSPDSPAGEGAGLAGMAERVGSVGGSMDAARAGDLFRVTVRVPEEVRA